jgi:hypothetical protein
MCLAQERLLRGIWGLHWLVLLSGPRKILAGRTPKLRWGQLRIRRQILTDGTSQLRLLSLL